MNTKTIAIVGLVVLLGGGVYYISQSLSPSKPAMEQTGGVMEKKDIAMEPTGAMMKKEDTNADTMMKKESRYITYTKAAFDAAKGKKRVYFFHAPWCPSCVPADKEFQANMDKIPENVVLFKTDYDTSSELKKQYVVTYQHTYVQVDDTGELVTKWNGGGIDELVANIK